MKIGKEHATIDNDFLNHITETNIDEKIIVETIKKVGQDLGLTIIVHPLVYENEIMFTSCVTSLFDEKVINKVEFDDIFQGNNDQKNYYIFLVTELFKTLKGKDSFPVKTEDVLSFWQRLSSLGEIHSLAMCMICECGIFLSDDDDSKKLAKIIKQHFLTQVSVYTRKEWFEKIQEEGKTTISRSIRHKLSHERN